MAAYLTKEQEREFDKLFNEFISSDGLKTSLSPNLKRFSFMTYNEMIQCEKEGWNCRKLNYTIDRVGNLEMDIPEGYDVIVILK